VIKEWGVGNPVVAFTPLNPVTPGHVLIVPRQHVATFAEDPALSGEVMRYAAMWVRDMQADANVITSIGSDATQTVPHLHVHIVPRRPGDALHLPWTGQDR